ALQSITNTGMISSSANLAMQANSISNYGTIAAAGALNVFSNTSIVNQSLNNVTASMIAGQTLNLFAGNGLIYNTGLMQPVDSIKIQTNASSALAINNTKGIIQAINGAINIRDIAYSGSANTTLTGGDFLSKELNIWGGSGNVSIDVGKLTSKNNILANE